jgi:hypothetical protein
LPALAALPSADPPVTLLLALALLVSPLPDTPPPGEANPSLPDSAAALYARKDPSGLTRLRAQARTVSDDLLLRYRLYPLTRDTRHLEDLPEPEPSASARDLALLSALWAYRTAEAPAWRIPAYGRRSDALLQRARALDPEDPFVLLVDGQSALYRPALFGGSAETALARFTRLRDALRRREASGRPVAGLPLVEAEVWVWYTLRKLGRGDTDALRDRLLAQNPPPLYREFLLDPP